MGRAVKALGGTPVILASLDSSPLSHLLQPDLCAWGRSFSSYPPLHGNCVSRETPVLRVTLTGAIPASVEPGFYPSRCGGHKNSENAATLSEFLGGRKNPGSAREPKENFSPTSPGLTEDKSV